MAHTLYTIDVWDTILRRRCHPDEVKLFTARALWLAFPGRLRPGMRGPVGLLHARQGAEHEIGLRALALGMDDEYRLDDVLERWIASVFDSPRPDEVRRVANWARSVEVSQEHRVTFADDGIAPILSSGNGVRRVALSDFYWSGDDLGNLISAKAPWLRLDEVVVSCDVGLNKRSGRLFRHVQSRSRVTSGQHVHVGDHPITDAATPAALGIHSVRYAPARAEAARAEHADRWSRRHDPAALAPLLLRSIAAEVAPPSQGTADQREAFLFGARCAPLYAGLVLRAIEEAVRRGVPTVHYFTREGVFFRRVHEAMQAAAPGVAMLGVPLPAAELLEVSRLSTFCPSIRDVSTSEFMRVWNLYSSQSIGGMLATLDIPEISVRPVLGLHGLDPGEVIQYPWTDPRVVSLLEDRRFAGTIDRARRQRRDRLRRYLESRNFRDDRSIKVIVDIGWRGTIQDNLAHVFPSCEIVGVYLGMHRTLNEQPGNATKIAYACDVAADEAGHGPLLEHVQPLEVLANSPDGSVTGYESVDGRVEPRRAEDVGESAVWRQATRFFQNGVIAAVPAVVRWIRDFACSSEDLRPMATNAVRGIVAAPPRSLARAFFNLRHNETFGLGGFVDMETPSPRSILRRVAHDPAAYQELWNLAGSSRWPCAFLRLHGLERERLWIARARYGYVPPVDFATVDPGHALASLREIEGSRSYHVIRSIKSLWPIRVMNRLRFGPGFDSPSDADAPARLAALTRSRTFRIIRALRHTRMARAMALRQYGIEALDRW